MILVSQTWRFFIFRKPQTHVSSRPHVGRQPKHDRIFSVQLFSLQFFLTRFFVNFFLNLPFTCHQSGGFILNWTFAKCILEEFYCRENSAPIEAHLVKAITPHSLRNSVHRLVGVCYMASARVKTSLEATRDPHWHLSLPTSVKSRVSRFAIDTPLPTPVNIVLLAWHRGPQTRDRIMRRDREKVSNHSHCLFFLSSVLSSLVASFSFNETQIMIDRD